MKKLLFALTILLICTTNILAIDSSFDIGVNISYDASDDIIKTSSSGIVNLDKIALGMEVRANISNFQMSINGNLNILDSDSLLFSGIFGGGFCVDMFKIFKISATVGPKISYVFNSSARLVDENGETVNGKAFIEALKSGAFNYRFMVDLLAGPVLSMGLAYTIETDFSITKRNYKELIPHRRDFKEGQVSLCLQMKLF